MMGGRADLIAWLTADTDVTDEVGTRIRMVPRQREAKPYVVLRQNGTNYINSGDGTSTQKGKEYTADIVGDTGAAVKTAADAVEARLAAARGVTQGSTYFAGVILVDRSEDIVEPDGGGDAPDYIDSISFQTWEG